MQIRIRNGNKYYRYTIWDKRLKKYRYLERKEPLKDFSYTKRCDYRKLSKAQITAIFEHFREGTNAFIPLHFIYIYGIDPKAVYDLTFSDCEKMDLTGDTKRILLRHKERIDAARRLYNHDEYNNYICVNLKTGKKLSNYHFDYIKKWIRKNFSQEIPLVK